MWFLLCICFRTTILTHLFFRYAVPDFPFAVDSKIECDNLNKLVNELLKG